MLRYHGRILPLTQYGNQIKFKKVIKVNKKLKNFNFVLDFHT